MAAPGEPIREADCVIVGGGSAGCVLAARLSENPERKVILLEAGGRDTSPYIHWPVTYYKTTTGPRFTWGYTTAPQKGQGGIAAPFAQARVLGGGSSINAQVYMRGTAQDYDRWRDELGCPGWGFADVLPYFLKAEDNQRLNGAAHGSGGPLEVSDQACTDPLTLAWLRACQQAGMPYNADFNGESRAGCGLYQVTNRNGRRSSAANCYLHPVERRANLEVMTGRRVARLVIEEGRATGVEVVAGDRRELIRARREVILTAGAIGTPHLMLLSGLGPAAHLQERGIAVVSDLPAVGQNLQDHLDVFLIYALAAGDSYDRYKTLRWQAWAGLQFALFRAGPMTSNVVEGGAFWWVDRREEEPDVQFHFLAGSGVEAGIAAVPGGSGCTLNAYLPRPRSRGTVTLADADPCRHPVIDPNYLAAPEDLQRTVDCVRLGRTIMRQAALRGVVGNEHFPGAGIEGQDELEDFVRRQARSGYHPAGTCRMGSDADAVVDTRLRVRGIAGLRIADNSIMPQLISANTNATAIMIGERAAEFIRENEPA